VARSWVKLWVNEWLDGTTRYEMSGAQRAFWVDLLALAGRSRCDGVICAGKTLDRFIGYPISRFEVLDAGREISVLGTLELFEQSGKIKIELTADAPTKLYKITILNWSRYQSEYDRQKRYRQVCGKVTAEVTRTVTLQDTARLLVEVEGEVKGEVEGEPEKSELNERSQRHLGETSNPSKKNAGAPVRVHGRPRVSLNPNNFTSPKKQRRT